MKITNNSTYLSIVTGVELIGSLLHARAVDVCAVIRYLHRVSI